MTDALTHDETMTDHRGQEGSGLLVIDGQTVPAKFHPLAQLFPMIEGEAFKALVEDVREHGVRRPIVLLDGMILDGRNRYMAARETGATYRVVEFTGDDPVAYVISENINRRHLTDAQRQMVGAKIGKLPKGGDRREEQTANWRTAPTTAQTAELLNTSVRGIERARVVVETGAPELVEAASLGEVSIAAAAEVAKLPQAEQVEIVSKGPEAVREAAKAVRQERATKPAAPSEPAAPVDPERRALAKMTTEGLIDEVIGLRANLADEKAKSAKLKAERDELKAQLKEAQATDGGRTVANLRREITTLKGRLNQHQTDAKRYEYRAKKAEARVKELENTPIDMGAP
ncbi:hypothetical protein [Brevundimonas balnearis]|uniref:ParB-like nuclease domain family n=1 Tax=Brevundimonas balnearis TaxID=1572858 RepID=A0ABV6R262_9CAUL